MTSMRIAVWVRVLRLAPAVVRLVNAVSHWSRSGSTLVPKSEPVPAQLQHRWSQYAPYQPGTLVFRIWETERCVMCEVERTARNWNTRCPWWEAPREPSS